MKQWNVVRRSELKVAGIRYGVQIFSRGDGNFFARTKLRDGDVIIIDGTSIEEVLARHRFSLPIAIDCRRRKNKRTVLKYPTQLT